MNFSYGFDFKIPSLFFFIVSGAPSDSLAESPSSLNGYYSSPDISPESGINGSLSILEANQKIWLSYESVFAPGARICSCQIGPLVREDLAKSSVATYSKKGDPDSFKVSVDGQKIRLHGLNPSCCGANWPGQDFDSSHKKSEGQICHILSPKANFYSLEEGQTFPLKSYLIRTDAVRVLNLQGVLFNDYVLAFFQGKNKFAGFLKKADLSCKKF